MAVTKQTQAQAKHGVHSSPPQERFQQLRQELNKIFLERQAVIDGVLAVLLTGGNVVLFGPPGCAKSWMIQELCTAISGATFFDRLLQPTITPDELLGQPSLQSLTQRDELIRNTRRRLPEAHIAFLDEVFRGNATSLNALLRLMNERVFENPEPQRVPLLFLCGAANNVPQEVVSQKKIKDKLSISFALRLRNHSEDFSNKLRLTYTVPLYNSIYLSFTHHIHCLKPF